MIDSTIEFAVNTTGTSFTAYLKKKYELYHLFLPEYSPLNDKLSKEELEELDALIANRDHFEIRQCIARRYHDQN